jgi:hypothetical protein
MRPGGPAELVMINPDKSELLQVMDGTLTPRIRLACFDAWYNSTILSLLSVNHSDNCLRGNKTSPEVGSLWRCISSGPLKIPSEILHLETKSRKRRSLSIDSTHSSSDQPALHVLGNGEVLLGNMIVKAMEKLPKDGVIYLMKYI